MKSLSELPAAGLRGIFCDIDDTLTWHGALVPEAYSALSRAHAAGLRVVPVTGRPAGWADVMAATWPVDAVVAENGGFVAVRRESGGRVRVEHLWWDSDEDRASQRARLDAIVREVLTLPRAKLAEDNWLRRCDVAFDVGETQSLEREEIDAIVRVIEGAGARSLVSTVHAHAFFGDHDKARMAVRVAGALWGEDLSASRGDYLFVGDSPNDQAGFAFFPRSVGVANVTRFLDRLNPPPAFVTVGEGGHGFAELIELLLSKKPI